MNAGSWMLLVLCGHSIAFGMAGLFGGKETKCPIFTQIRNARDVCIQKGTGDYETMGNIMKIMFQGIEDDSEENMDALCEELIALHGDFFLCLFEEMHMIDMKAMQVNTAGIAEVMMNAGETLVDEELLESLIEDLEECNVDEATEIELCVCAFLAIDDYCEEDLFQELANPF